MPNTLTRRRIFLIAIYNLVNQVWKWFHKRSYAERGLLIIVSALTIASPYFAELGFFGEWLRKEAELLAKIDAFLVMLLFGLLLITRALKRLIDPSNALIKAFDYPATAKQAVRLFTVPFMFPFKIVPFNTNDFNNQLDTLLELWVKAYHGISPFSYQNRYKTFKAWIKKNPDIVCFICDHTGRAVGYMIIVSMRSRSHYKGTIGHLALNAKHICAQGEASDLIYFHSIFIDKKYRKKAQIRALFVSNFYRMCAGFIKNPGKAVIYSDKFTNEGGGLLKKMGFFSNGNRTKDKFNVLELHMDETTAGLDIPQTTHQAAVITRTNILNAK